MNELFLSRRGALLVCVLLAGCPRPGGVCGDGEVGADEACDDGNTNAGDGCSPACTVEPGARCGDGVKSAAEACDDGARVAGDGCSVTCAVEPGWSCSGSPSTCAATCGDGVKSGAEACDDGDTDAGDGCSATCTLESGWLCTGAPSACVTTCGDGVKAGAEACDDSDNNAGDGCSATCTIESGWSCAGSPSQCTAGCGDGVKVGSEACDDGAMVAGDGCSAACAVEGGWSCSGSPSTCVTTCGDGISVGTEACDDGATVAGDGCSATCTVESGWTCSGGPSACVTVCGDGLKTGTEACDDHGTTGGDGCSSSCTVESGWQCSGSPSTCGTTCGDGIMAGGEACDDGPAADGDGCDSSCAVEPGWTCSGSPSSCATTCGDGVIAGGEACDDGDLNGGDGCSSLCEVESGWACGGSPSTCGTTCGDGIKTGSEACDDGALNAGDGCSSTCTLEPGWACSGSPSSCATTCGDGVIAGTELCDDGASNVGDGCSSSCDVEAGWSCSGAPSTCAAVCGDGLLAGAEACDDGALNAGDGCSTTCTVESGWSCTGAPSLCGTTCGDGVRSGSEACDDGNLIALDGCNAQCKTDLFVEQEPNDVVAAANGPFAYPVILRGALNPAADVDVFHLVLPSTTDLWLETTDETGTGCLNLDTVVTLLGADGVTELASDDDLGQGNCSKLDSRSDARVAHLAAGTYFVKVSAYAAFRAVPAYKLWVRFNASCGDAVVSGSEQCDGTPNCDATCRRVETCGDGFVDGTERCDDGAIMSGDGCSSSCDLELFSESEPNNSAASANGPSARDVLLGGAITPAGDADFFAISLTSTSDLKLETFDATGVTCSGVDTVLTLYAADGSTVLVTRDQGGPGNCASIDPSRSIDASARHLPAGTYFVKVEESLNDGTIPAYRLLVTRTATCGNGVVEGFEECDGALGCTATCDRTSRCSDGFIDAPESCDDGNAAGGDGCSASCGLEGFTETEPNDSIATSNGPVAPFAQFSGALPIASDADFFAVTVASTADLSISTATAQGAGHCDRAAATTVTFYDPSGTVLVSDDGFSRDGCARLDAKHNVALRQLAPGTYFVKVSSSVSAPVPGYTLQLSQTALCGDGVAQGYETCDGTASCSASCTSLAVCGNGLVEAPELCDDGDVSSGDGCSATCAPELADVEPNDTLGSASGPFNGEGAASGSLSSGDNDFYALTMAAAGVVTIETYDGSGIDCSVATSLKVFDQSGVALYADDNSGVASCSALVLALPAGSFTVQVGPRTSGATVPAYVLSIRAANSSSEVEPDDVIAQATAVGGSYELVVVGSHQLNLDADFISFTVPTGRSVRAELIEGGAEACESYGIDSLLTLYSPSGQILGWDDDSGRGLCSRIDGEGANADSPYASRLPGGTYTLEVGAAPFAQNAGNPAGQFDYRLVISIR